MSFIENEENSSCADGQELQTHEAEYSANESQNESEKTPEANDTDVKKAAGFNSEDEQETYKKVLEKLEAKTSDIQEKFMPDETLQKELYPISKSEKSPSQVQMEKIVAQDFIKIQNLEKQGLINPLQGQNLKNMVLKKAFEKLVQNGAIKQNSSPVSQKYNKNEVFSEFHKENPNFFSADGRGDVLDYLKSDDVILGKDELKKISKLVENIENKAIERYLKNEAHQKNLLNSNEAAKQKLTANAQNSSFSDKNFSRVFTREQIGKMSGKEFAKYESLIMEQLRKGLIR